MVGDSGRNGDASERMAVVSPVAVEQARLSKNRTKKRDKEYRIEDIRKDLAVIPGC